VRDSPAALTTPMAPRRGGSRLVRAPSPGPSPLALVAVPPQASARDAGSGGCRRSWWWAPSCCSGAAGRFLRAAMDPHARHRTATMDTLITTAVLAAYAASVWHFVSGGGPVSTTEPRAPSATGPQRCRRGRLTLLVGRGLEAAARSMALSAVGRLLALGAREASVVVGDTEVRIPVGDVQVEDVVRVRPARRSLSTASSSPAPRPPTSRCSPGSPPVEKAAGDTVVGATLNCDGTLDVRATAVGRDSVLAGIVRLVEDAQNRKGARPAPADRLAGLLVPAVLAAAVATFAAWALVHHDPSAGLMRPWAVLVVACPLLARLAPRRRAGRHRSGRAPSACW